MDPPRSDAGTEAPAAPAAALRPAARPRRQPRWIAAGVLAICLGGLGSALLYAEATGTREVLQVTRPLHRGEVVGPGDLRPLRVGSLTGVSTVDADRSAELVGRRALIDLAGGSVLPAEAIGQPVVDRGFTQVGVKLAPGRLPVGDLPPGTTVVLFAVDDTRVVAAPAPTTGPASAAAGAAAVAPVPAVVVSAPRTGPDGVASLLDVRVPQDRARQVAELAAADRLVLVREG